MIAENHQRRGIYKTEHCDYSLNKEWNKRVQNKVRTQKRVRAGLFLLRQKGSHHGQMLRFPTADFG